MKLKKIGILLVHGIGEQRWCETLESVTTNFHRSLISRPGLQVSREVLSEGSSHRFADQPLWREAPVRIRWRNVANQSENQVVFREVYWADLDVPKKGLDFLRFVFWGLTIAAVKRFDESDELHKPAAYNMRSPRSPGSLLWVRGELLVVSTVFLMVLLTVGIANWLLRRIFQVNILNPVLRVLYNYLGDIKLYQDESPRTDRIEAESEKSRVPIRRRMVTALVRMASDDELDEYYIVAHSLGTVVSFNALMEPEAALPNYLTEELWLQARSAKITKTLQDAAPDRQMPARPSWIGPKDGIDRQKLFGKLRGFMTLGSPLDKFAAIWPRIVPINDQPVAGGIPWLNVYDARDIVGAKLDLFGASAGGFQLKNYEWADQKLLFSAHTSYWKAGKQNSAPTADGEAAKRDWLLGRPIAGRHVRLIDRLIDWVGGAEFEPPDDSTTPALALALQLVLIVFVFGFVIGAGWFVWTTGCGTLEACWRAVLENVGVIVWPNTFYAIAASACVVLVLSLARWLGRLLIRGG